MFWDAKSAKEVPDGAETIDEPMPEVEEMEERFCKCENRSGYQQKTDNSRWCVDCGYKLSAPWYVPDGFYSPHFAAQPAEETEEINRIHNTTVETKREHWTTFSNLIANQFNHGGDKYKLEGFEDREATDLICQLWEKPGDELKWLLKTIMKYVFRLRTQNREKDWLKIATYCYIGWLKCGHHLKESHDEDVQKEEK